MQRRKKPNSTATGKQFENEVAALFAAAGYKVDRNQPVLGQQIDLIATHFEALGLQQRQIIECKYKSTGAVSNNEVQDFVTFVQPLLTKGFGGGVLVTNSDFSLSAKSCAEGYPFITLKTYSELEDSLFDFSRSFVSEINSYQNNAIANAFIKLSGKRLRQESRNARTEEEDVPLLEDLIGNVSQDDRPILAFILGDFGVGKTTIIERANYELQQQYIKDRKSKIPLVFKLNKFVEASSLNQYLESQIAFNLRIQVPASRVLQLCKAGRAVVFLDGFDEIATNASEYRRLSYFENLLPLIEASKYAVISSRPSYFKDAKEFEALLARVLDRRLSFEKPSEGPIRKKDEAARSAAKLTWHALSGRILGEHRLEMRNRVAIVYYVNKLNREQIVEYISEFKADLQKKHKLSPSQIYDLLMKVYDISDLMTRPLLLKLIVEILLISTINLKDENLSIGPAALYRMYIDAHLAIDWSKGAARHFLEKDERLKFAKGMALAMLYGDGSLSVSYTNIVDTIINVAHSFKREREQLLIQQVDEVCTDVRVCAFLRFRDQERFEFIHKSFMEYFVADEIRECLRSNSVIDILRLNLNYEILYFLGSFVLIDANIMSQLFYQLRNIAYREGEIYKRNVLGALLYSGQGLAGLKISAASLDRLKFRSLRLESLEVEQSSFVGLVAEALSCIDVSFRETDVDRSFCGEMSFIDCTGAVTLTECQIGVLKISGGETFEVDLHRSAVDAVFAERNRAVHISSHSLVRKLVATGAAISLHGLSDPEYALHEVTCRDCSLQTTRGVDGSARRGILKGRFVRCRFRNFRMLYSETKESKFEECIGVIVAEEVQAREIDFFRTYRGDANVIRRKWMYRDGVLYLDGREWPTSQVIQLEGLYYDFDPADFAKDPVRLMDRWIAILNPPAPPEEKKGPKKRPSNGRSR